MNRLDEDRRHLPDLLQAARDEAVRFLDQLDDQPAGRVVPAIEALGLPDEGLGARGALDALRERYGPWWSGSPGPRYFAFVTGGATPAALVGDWLTGAYDQNGSDAGESGARHLVLDALDMMRDLLGVPETFRGAFVTGATTSSTVALATARQWVGRQRGVDVSIDGAAALGPVTVLSGTAHSSIPKALSVIGLGRAAVQAVATLDGREAVDPGALEAALVDVEASGRGPVIVVANSGTVNTCDFDDLRAIAALRDRHAFWLHVDAAFGGIAAASPRYRPWLEGLDQADSITVDAHKWLNVPYDGAIVLTRHFELHGETFRSSGAYLPTEVRPDTFLHLTPENSQRLRALPIWMTLAAYGRAGHAEVVERCCDLASWLGERLDRHPRFELLAPARLNGLCFGMVDSAGDAWDSAAVAAYLDRLRADGTAFLTPTRYQNRAAARVSITNWRTEQGDIEATWRAMQRVLETP